jgi:hypothetical protein
VEWRTHWLGGDERGWGVNSSEDARHCSVLYICKYFVGTCLRHNPDLLAFIPYNFELSNPVMGLPEILLIRAAISRHK